MIHTTLNWFGGSGLPGFSNFYFNLTPSQVNADSAVQATSNFADAIHFYLPSGVSTQASLTAESIDPANGDLLASYTAVVTAPIWAGSITGPYSAAAGAVINWRTAGIHRGHRVRGRTFIVPAGDTVFTNGGVVASGAQAALTTAGQAMVTAGLGVWARPKGPPPVVAGAIYAATAASVPTKGAILRSRRD